MVDPPSATTNLIAFSKDFRVIISKGFKSLTNRFLIALPQFSDSITFILLLAGFEELKGKDIPKASIADAIVLAVYIPPHAPAPGQAFLIIDLYSWLSILPETLLPHASKAETMSNFLPL